MMRSACILFAAAIFVQCTAPVSETPPDASSPPDAPPPDVPQPAISPNASVVTVSRPSIQSGDTATLILRTKNSDGADLYVPGTVVAFSVNEGSSTVTIGKMTDHGDGMFSAVFTGDSAGTPAAVTATINGVVVTNPRRPTIQVMPGVPDVDRSRIALEWGQLQNEHSMWVRLESFDKRGNRVATGGHEVAFQVTPENAGTVGPASDLKNGTYEARLTALQVGSLKLQATMDQQSIDSASSINVDPAPEYPSRGDRLLDPAHLSAHPMDLEPGQATTISFTAYPRERVRFAVAGTASGVLSEVVDHDDGTYTATWVARDTGWAEFRVTYDGTTAMSFRPMVWVSSPVTPQFSPTRTDLGTLGGSTSTATDINSSGAVVGWAATPSGLNHAFLWTAATGMTDLGTLPGDSWSAAMTITDDGKILGVSGKDQGQILGVNGQYGSAHGQPVVWSSDGTVTKLEIPLLPGYDFGFSVGMNRYGYVVGWDMEAVQHAWIWSAAGGKLDISGSRESASLNISDAGWVVGARNNSWVFNPSEGGARGCVHHPDCWRSFVWKWSDGLIDLGVPGTEPETLVEATAANDRNVVTGSALLGFSTERAFRWTREKGFSILAANSYGADINLNDMVVGQQASRPAAWPANGGMVLLENSCSGTAVAVNDQNVSAGYANCGLGRRATMWTLTPGAMVAAAAPSIRTGTPRGRPSACETDPTLRRSRGGLMRCLLQEDQSR